VTSAPRLTDELEAVADEKALAEAGWVVALLASRHPQPHLRVVMAALWEVLRAEADVRSGDDGGTAAREAAIDSLLDRLHDLPEGLGPKLLDWKADHIVTRLLRAAWRDHSHHMWTTYEAEEFLGGR
jgi:hypothetical protein